MLDLVLKDHLPMPKDLDLFQVLEMRITKIFETGKSKEGFLFFAYCIKYKTVIYL